MNTMRLMTSRHRAALVATMMASTLAACGGGGGGGGGDDRIPLSDPNAVMVSLGDKVASPNGSVDYIPSGAPPAPTGDGLTPKVTGGVQATAEPGETVSLPVSIGGAPSLAALYAKVPGAGSYFQVNLGGAGKASDRVAKLAGKQTGGGFNLTTIIGFNVALPANLETGDQFCFEFSAKDANGNVSSTTSTADRSCVTVVSSKPTPTNDQPNAQTTPTALQGVWNSPCFDVSEGEEVESVREVINFVGSNGYSTFFDFYPNRTCTGTPERFQAPGGTYALAGAAVPDAQGKYARPVDFVPDPADPNFGNVAATCFNLLRLEGAGGNFDRLFLGYPIPFSIDFEGAPEPVAGDCRSEGTRPTFVITSLPFTRG
jgi:hypothetical protein